MIKPKSYMKYNYDRERKSHIEHEFTEIIIHEGISGSVIGLVGPEYKRHYNHYSKIANGKEITIAERDPKAFKHLSDKMKEHPEVSVINGDIFDILKSHPGVALFDFDACASPDGLVDEGFKHNLNFAFDNRLFRTEKFAMILTFSQRNELPGSGDNLIDSIKKIADKYRHSITRTDDISYRQATSAPMRTILFIIQPNPNNPSWMKWKERTRHKTGARLLNQKIKFIGANKLSSTLDVSQD